MTTTTTRATTTTRKTLAIDKIKRNLVWLRRALGIIDKTTLPGEILGEVRPTIDTFGWERLPEEQFLSTGAPDPAIAIASEPTPENTLRIVYAASLEHSDVAVNHVAWMIKRRNPGALDVGLPTDRQDIDAGEFLSMIGTTFLVAGDFIIAEILGAPVAGQLTLRLNVVDVDIGEYVPPIQ